MMSRQSVHMTVRQQPVRAQVVQESNPKNRKPIDPPPIVELKYDGDDKANGQWMVSPRTFMMVTLIRAKESDEQPSAKFLIGQTVSSLHRLKDACNNKEGGYFVFGDISARRTGSYKLRFSLFDSVGEPEEVVFIDFVDSEPFTVFAQRDFGSMSESTALTRAFSDQGVKLRVRKDNRATSSVGMKRTFSTTSPVTSSSPQHHSNPIYGGPVQDHHHYAATTPDVKRQRADSDYGNGTYPSFSMSESYHPQYHSHDAIPSSVRQWGADYQSRGHTAYLPQSVPVYNRVPSMQMHSGWQNMPLPETTYGYMQSNGILDTESSEDSAAYSYMGDLSAPRY